MNTELSLKVKSNVNDILNWLGIVRNVTPSYESVSYNLYAPIWMALRKRVSLFKFASERQWYPERGGGFPQKRGRFQSWRKLWPDLNSIILM